MTSNSNLDKTQLENIKTVSQWRGGRWWQAWSEWRHWQNLKRCFCGKWQILHRLLNWTWKALSWGPPMFKKIRRFQEGDGGEGRDGYWIKWRIESEDSCYSAKFLSSFYGFHENQSRLLCWWHHCWIQRLLFIHVTIVVRSFKGWTLRQNST